MRNKNFLFVLLFLKTSFCTIFAQVDSLNELPSINVIATPLVVFDQLDSVVTKNHSFSSLDVILQEQTGVYLKSYGQGSLASPSFRGSGFGHTAVFWNGFNLQHPMNGGLDFSLIPISNQDQLQLQKNGISSLQGNGSIGGAIHWNTNWNKKTAFLPQLYLGIGSFGEQKIRLSTSLSHQKYSGNIQLFGKRQTNDFTYLDGRANEQKQLNASLQNYGILQNNEWKIGNNQLLKTWLWYQNSNREIPPSRVENNTNALQLDEFFRVGTEWNYLGKKSIAKVRFAYLSEDLIYQSDLISPSHSFTQVGILEGIYEREFSSTHLIRLGWHYQQSRASADELDNDVIRHENAFYSAYQMSLFKQKLQLNPSLRIAFVEGEFIPTLWSFHSQYFITKALKWQASISKNYKLPTFNDLYWSGQGNPNLLPENGFGWTSGIAFDKAIEKWDIHLNTEIFQNRISNWILWSPNTLGIWRPSNQQKVHARGVELNARFNYQWTSNWRFQFSNTYTLTKSTIEERLNSSSTAIVGSQLPYVPIHLWRSTFGFSYNTFRLSYLHTLQSQLFTTTDNLQTLNGFHLGGLQLSVQKDWKKISTQWNLHLRNLWNTNYQTIAFRPMPRRNFTLSLQLSFL